MDKKVKTLFGRILRILSISIVTLIILVGTVAVYYYAQGYRVNIDDGSVRGTGVLSVESIPSKATIFVDGKERGRTPKSVPSVDEGNIKLKLTRDGYRDWTKNVSILAEKSSPVYAQMILTDFKEVVVREFSDPIYAQYESKDGRYIILVTKSAEGLFSVYQYDVYVSFWDLTPNPELIYTIENPDVTDINLILSPDGKMAVVEETIGDELSSTYILHTVQNGDLVQALDLIPFYNDEYKVSWSNNSKYVLLESDKDILSINTSNSKRFVLYKKGIKEDSVWTTDYEGYFYYLKTTQEDSKSYYTLYQTSMEGTDTKTVIEKIYSYEVDRYVSNLSTNDIEYLEFTNAPANTKFAGEITNIWVNQEAGGIYIKTTSASYWYNITKKKYVLTSSTPSDYVSLTLAEDLNRIIFKDSLGIGVFTFDKEKSDPTTVLGSRYVFSGEYETMSWFDENYILYSANSKLFLVDFDGDNNYEIMDSGKLNTGNELDNTLHLVRENSIFKYDLDSK